MHKKSLLAGIIVGYVFCVVLLWRVNIHLYWSDASYKEKVWLHRTNTPEKLMEFSEEYDGFECDILLRNDSILDITHDEPVSYQVGADSYFRLLGMDSNRRIWFDFKNLKSDNVSKILAIFENLLQIYSVQKNQLIIEGSDPEALKIMHDAGFYTAYYVPMVRKSTLSPEEKHVFYAKLNEIAQSGNIDALSFYVRQYADVKTFVTSDIDLLTWAHHETKEELSLFPRGRRLLKDDQVKIILVKDKGHYHK